MKKMKRRSVVSPTGLPEDIVVAEILPRLHVKPLFRFKCVSKLFNSVVSDPNFELRYMQRAYSSPESSSSSGLVSSFLIPFTDLSPYRFSKNVKKLGDSIYPGAESINVATVSPLYRGRHKIVGSSNGLILARFSTRLNNGRWGFGFCVSNPLTEQSTILPNLPKTRPLDYSHSHIATRRDQTSDFLSYKVVVIGHCKTVYIISSDTGRWASRQLDFPSNNYRPEPFVIACKGVLHWLGHATETVIAYDPFDSPNRFTLIRLPGQQSMIFDHCLVYSNHGEMLKYCKIEYHIHPAMPVDMWVWRLVESSGEREWCLEGKFRISMPYINGNHRIITPNHWSRDVICLPFVKDNKVWVLNRSTGRRKYVNVFKKGRLAREFYADDIGTTYTNPLIPVEMCPWSSPFYAQSNSS